MLWLFDTLPSGHKDPSGPPVGLPLTDLTQTVPLDPIPESTLTPGPTPKRESIVFLDTDVNMPRPPPKLQPFRPLAYLDSETPSLDYSLPDPDDDYNSQMYDDENLFLNLLGASGLDTSPDTGHFPTPGPATEAKVLYLQLPTTEVKTNVLTEVLQPGDRPHSSLFSPLMSL